MLNLTASLFWEESLFSNAISIAFSITLLDSLFDPAHSIQPASSGGNCETVAASSAQDVHQRFPAYYTLISFLYEIYDSF